MSSALDCAKFIAQAFSDYNTEFRAITRRAPKRFQERDLRGSQQDAVERIELYDRFVNATVAQLRTQLGEHALDRGLWRETRRRFPELIEDLPDKEFVKTFFSSIARRLFGTVGVAPDIEFVALDLNPLGNVTSEVITQTYPNRGSLEMLFEQALSDFHFHTWRDFDRSVAHIAAEVQAHCLQTEERRAVQRVEIIRPVFYQMTRAYLIGRVSGRDWKRPLVIALKNTEGGVLVDAVMMRESDISIIFSFTRSYFHVDLERVGEAVVFLKSLLPLKPVSELFTVLGRAKQGKTERYRELFRHLQQNQEDSFEHAAGDRGLVMVCFTLPSFDVVFKVIRDRFPEPKNIMRQEVMAKYELVFKHDRAGRLVDAQEFRRLRFPRNRFSPQLLEELSAEAANSVHAHTDDKSDDLIFDHLYIERRLTPLNLYLRGEQPTLADKEKAVLDYGQAIRDLAYTNIFAGDLLLKNFGVTRHGRVIFYDYDELCQVTDCRFRELPQAQNDEDEMRAESWFYVADNDVFPETFLNFLGLEPHLKKVFLETHGEILTAEWWRHVQEKHREGELMEVLPYHPRRVRVASSY